MLDFETRSGSLDSTTEDSIEGSSPNHQAYVRSSFDLPWNLQADVTVRYADSLPELDVPSYVEADVRIGWRPMKDLEIYVAGQNLLHDEHLEYESTPFGLEATEVPRSVTLGVNWRF
jgi:iron complex outermembrane receptor protein